MESCNPNDGRTQRFAFKKDLAPRYQSNEYIFRWIT